MSKFGTFGGYPKESLLSAEAALLTAWRSLDRYHNDLVLVGGLAVHYLTKRDGAGLPGAVTMDVDFGISLTASGEQYGTIKSELAGLDFRVVQARCVRDAGIMLFRQVLGIHDSAENYGIAVITTRRKAISHQ